MSGHDGAAGLMVILTGMMEREPVAAFTSPTVIKAALDLAECVLVKVQAATRQTATETADAQVAEVDALERLYSQRARRRDQRHPARPESEAE